LKSRPAAPTTSRIARAKINLALHIISKRTDGYHLLDSLAAFADVGDRISVSPARELSLTVTGPMAATVPRNEDNLVLRAARLLGGVQGAHITLEKILPVASGIGGGSSDAAAALRLLCDLWSVALPDCDRLIALGADIPVCLSSAPQRMRGTGDKLDVIANMPTFEAVLVTPNQELSTAAVFAALETTQNLPLGDLPSGADRREWIEYISRMRNDMQSAAIGLAPSIGGVCSALSETNGCDIARMSGSGATCFGLFARADDARLAARELRVKHPHWWVVQTRIGQDTRSTT